MPDATLPQSVDAAPLYRKISWRLIPYLFFLYILAYLDRVNVGFAAVEMRHDLALSATVYGTGAGIYFLGQGLFDLPSNLLLNRVGPRLWIARIMISWGIVATCMSLIKGPHSFYAMRLLLGIAEAGFFPGMILYLTFWFPSQRRARAVAGFLTAISLAGVIGAPISSAILRLEGRSRLHGWQWLFLLEGIPTILAGISVLFLLPNHPRDATFLSDPEKQFLNDELERDQQQGGASNQHRLADAFKTPMVWILGTIFLLDLIGVYTISLWMPSVLSSILGHGTQPAATGNSGHAALLSTLPYLVAALTTVLVGISSDRTGDRRWHMIVCLLLGGVGFAWASVAHTLIPALLAFTLASVGFFSIMGPFWALPTRVLGGNAAAGGIAIITVIGSVGSFAGPFLTGKLRDVTHGFTAGLLTLAAIALCAAALCLALPSREKVRQPAGS